MGTFYLTTPIYYPNARPHVGSAYTTIVCDVLARYKRMCGYDVAFLTGTDEHGEKLQRAADAAGIPVEKFVAEKRELFKDLWRTLGISEYDPERPADYGYRFVHTSQNPGHVKAVHWMIRQADKAGYIKKKKYEGRYCVFDERYVSDGPEPANCDICGRPAELISEENYFFKLAAFGPSEPGREDGRLMTLYREHPEFVQPDFRMNEVKSFVKGGLRDISISRRRLKWGIPWPDDAEQVVYVWYDALTSYLTGLGFEGDQRSRDFEKYWMGEGREGGERQVVHMIGKDILRFHAVYWPAFLMAANDALPETERLPLPTTVFAHGWIYYEQDKMSKSKGNVVYPEPIVVALNELVGYPTHALRATEDNVGDGLAAPKTQRATPVPGPGNDALRYYLVRDTPFGLDGNFSYEGLVDRYNFDLANDLGNLASRTVHLMRLYGFVVPGGPDALMYFERGLEAIPGPTKELRESARQACKQYIEHLQSHGFSLAAEVLWGLVRDVNAYLNKHQPWTRNENAETVLYATGEALRFLAVMAYPILPHGASKIWQQVGCENYLGSIEEQRLDGLEWGGLRPGTEVRQPKPIFPRLKDRAEALAKLEEFAEADRERTKGTTVMEQSAVSPQQSALGGQQSSIVNQQSPIPKITIDDFAKVEMLVGQIVSAEAIPGAKKLLKLQVDVGTETRQVCAGIAEYYPPEQLVGMKIVLVANLEPRKLRGVESNGMVVAASAGPEAKPVLATFKEDVPNGTRLK